MIFSLNRCKPDGHMNERTYGFAVTPHDGTILITQDEESEIIISPLEVDALVIMLQEAKKKLLVPTGNSNPRHN